MERSTIVRLRAALLAGVLQVVVGTQPAHANEPPFPVFNEWWQWAMSIPAAVNPVLDNTGQRCALGQRGTLWFLAGNTGGHTQRRCTLPAGTRVLIPIHNTFCFLDANHTRERCAAEVSAHFGSFVLSEVSFSGAIAPEVFEQPPAPGEWEFAFAVPRNALFGYKPGVYRATVSAGRWTIATLPEPGLYTLRVRSQDTAGRTFDVTYHLTVAEVN